mmetsp:Transcript_20226/g.30007  ORF Transcript_20226/g.30007 Transcript_20226/m.30007 type:complete len:138 (+) Transcript_20226:123-536(+)|eukprot:CAMPEP_0194201794 /NCGR_PEP_ID=MMETSP0156-20130528/1974_1 /TAXON_ID=33649 /ORGANISM="Thalassionema nitzschioides, Strain L26-B" /LENGTH=137 /DNA_ID=CAMNT_0038927087 /DNA_START=64 /DNA_END=477 /DNA_ORIENTATION=-
MKQKLLFGIVSSFVLMTIAFFRPSATYNSEEDELRSSMPKQPASNNNNKKASFPFLLRKTQQAPTSENREVCVAECNHGNLEEGFSAENLHIVCMDSVEKFAHDYNDCIDVMTQALDLGEAEAQNQYCDFICPYAIV